MEVTVEIVLRTDVSDKDAIKARLEKLTLPKLEDKMWQIRTNLRASVWFKSTCTPWELIVAINNAAWFTFPVAMPDHFNHMRSLMPQIAAAIVGNQPNTAEFLAAFNAEFNSFMALGKKS